MIFIIIFSICIYLFYNYTKKTSKKLEEIINELNILKKENAELNLLTKENTELRKKLEKTNNSIELLSKYALNKKVRIFLLDESLFLSDNLRGIIKEIKEPFIYFESSKKYEQLININNIFDIFLDY